MTAICCSCLFKKRDLKCQTVVNLLCNFFTFKNFLNDFQPRGAKFNKITEFIFFLKKQFNTRPCHSASLSIIVNKKSFTLVLFSFYKTKKISLSPCASHYLLLKKSKDKMK